MIVKCITSTRHILDMRSEITEDIILDGANPFGITLGR